jgi:prepilin peptidase CpaA
MTHDTVPAPTPDTLTPPEAAPAPAPADDLGIDRAFLLSMAQIPLIALGFTALAWAASLVAPVLPKLGEANQVNTAPLVLICLGMILAAVIDGVWFKVPNWLTLSLVVSGWLVGGLVNLNVHIAGPNQGGFFHAIAGTALGFFIMYPILAIGGMGQGDVKMTMGFGSWVAVIFGNGANNNNYGLWVIITAWVIGVIVGGVFGLVMMVMRRQFGTNAANFGEIVTDLKVMVEYGPKAAAQRANQRRPNWVRLPYGVPLCVGFVGYLAYLHYLTTLPTGG